MPMVTSESYRKSFDLTNKLKSLRRASKTLFQLGSSKSLPDTSQAGITANLPQPPFPHLLRSNTPPTESEISLLQDAIAIAEEEKSRLKEMASSHTGSDRLVLTARNLACELDRTHQFIMEHNVILSSIRRIPPEVLQYIFIHTLPTPTATPGSKVLCNSQLPWALSQVCQLWRIIMLSFSAMWRDLPIVDLTLTHTKEKPYLDLLTELLKRSYNMPICFTLERGSNQDITHPVIDMLVLHSDRWQEIKIDGPLDLLPAFKKIKGRLSSLQSLYLYLHSPYYSPIVTDHTTHDLFQIAPQLRHVDFTGPATEFIFPAHQLVHYSQQGAYLEQVIQVVFSSPSLRNLRFYVLEFTEAITLPMVALRLPDLIVLDAYFHASSNVYELFFDNITTPAIEELVVTTVTENTIRPIRSMILRSGSPCLLKELYLQVHLAPGELQSLLRLTPLVTHLAITFPPAQDIAALIFDGNTPPLVPLLSVCEFFSKDEGADTSLSTETIQALKLLASSRCELPNNTASTDTLLSGECHLRALRISLGWRSTQYRRYFEGWVYSDMAIELYKQHGRLLDMLPELDDQRYVPSNRKFNLKWKNNVTGLLTHLEHLKIEKASDICMSGIQYILYAISISFIKGDVRFSFSQIAKRILQKWEPIIRDDMPNIRWLSTALALEYLSTTQNNALRSSPDAMKFFCYGLDTNDIPEHRYLTLYGMIARSMDF